MSNIAVLTSNENGADSLTGINNNFAALNTDKAEKASPTFTGTVVLPSTTSIGNVSSTELGYVDGVTSAVQTQIDTKAPTASPTFTGTVVLPTVTIGGNMTFNENTALVLDPALSADGKYCGVVEVVTAGETVAFGEVVYLKAADSRYYLTDADADSTAGAVKIAMAVTAGTSGNTMTVLHYGKIRADAKFPTLTIGAPAYISTTAGAIQVAQPSGTDDVIRIIGHALTADELFFNPSNDYITHA